MNQATKYPELNAVLNTFVECLKTLLGDNLLAVYLQGSFALGGGDEDSDVDFFVLLKQAISDEQLPQLESLHQRLFDIPSYWSHHLEGSYFTLDILKESYPNFSPIVYVDNGSRNLELSTHDNELVVRWVTREHGITLYGENPKTYIDPIETDLLKTEVKSIMQQWGNEIMTGTYVIDNDWAQSFAVIMYCRMLQTLATGAIHSKPSAVKWGQDTLDSQWHRLITEAWQKRPNQYKRIADIADPGTVSKTIDFIRYALTVSDK